MTLDFFLIAVNAALVAKPLILVFFFSISVVLALLSNFLTNQQVSGILLSNSVLSVSYLVFQTNPLGSILFTFLTNLP